MTADTILIDGSDLSSTARILQVWGGVHTVAGNRGSGFIIPERHGITDDIDRPFEAGVLGLGLMLRGGAPDVTGFNDAYRALLQLCKPGRKVTLTRRLSFATGNEDHTASARYISGLDPDMQTPADGKMFLRFLILDGLWYATALTPTIPATITVPGTAKTNRMTLVLPGTGTLTNTTLGVSVAVTAAQTLTVETKQTTGTLSTITHAGDPLGNWFTLAPGSNVITWSGGGTPTISYQPAYL